MMVLNTLLIDYIGYALIKDSVWMANIYTLSELIFSFLSNTFFIKSLTHGNYVGYRNHVCHQAPSAKGVNMQVILVRVHNALFAYIDNATNRLDEDDLHDKAVLCPLNF